MGEHDRIRMEYATEIDRLTRENEAMRKALEAAGQRANESGTGEIALLDTIHAMARIIRAALSSLKERAR